MNKDLVVTRYAYKPAGSAACRAAHAFACIQFSEGNSVLRGDSSQARKQLEVDAVHSRDPQGTEGIWVRWALSTDLDCGSEIDGKRQARIHGVLLYPILSHS